MKIDKKQWRRGPWDSEPDSAKWIERGLHCAALRHPYSGHWRGYIAVPDGHPLYGESTPKLACHGDVSYAAPCACEHLDHCEVTGNGHVWWFGFACSTNADLLPSDRRDDNREYRDLNFVKRQCRSLALQLS